ncbi:MAG: thermonuclease family protein [Candidatus Pelagibacter sp. TMED263]|nr:MAG: thermonuclease family protein [Candidatus Pelagibacter sp. TMED263]|tara:strand:+ start:9 stop:500 length:492 start_codon:yes stop_codon:yes gene_type:complete
MIKYIIIILTLFYFQIIQASEIIGLPKVIDGDSIHIKSYKIRLEGIDAPEISQKCKKPYLQIIFFTFQKDYYCGQVSKKKLIQKIGNKSVKCILLGKDRYKRYLAKCFKGTINLNKWMVRSGYAIAYRKYSKIYIPDENFAKEEKLGLWGGSFIKPEKWRKLN